MESTDDQRRFGSCVDNEKSISMLLLVFFFLHILLFEPRRLMTGCWFIIYDNLIQGVLGAMALQATLKRCSSWSQYWCQAARCWVGSWGVFAAKQDILAGECDIS
ncbi:hypothetical protein VFPPC_15136 [Pochonia chlamydosporia 170]|uniref:Uncharacterized protein n=1 Tax=Pochonia chlamydosporia 170 TaxID=1380566 RepID=A0A179G3K9_METCM|nr:hypothetical protein VFPPC_15136 [Pochonia chlamydosporia 170]OAQ72455.1 hypothetical protein VFPPC_15136 [Pochonia chlamydosporia 170]